jgi:outer membrane protein assembly factor BamB
VCECTQAPAAALLPPGWAQHTTDDGDVYYYNASTDESRWTLPSGAGGRCVRARVELANTDAHTVARWTRHVDDNGDVYYYNATTDESKWELTSAEVRATRVLVCVYACVHEHTHTAGYNG